MGLAAILTALTTATAAVQQARKLYDDVKGTLVAGDQAQLDAALANLERANDDLFEEVMGKLRDAATR